MELRHIRYFVAVAEELSFTRAAERLHIGQPPLSQQIQALEEEIEAKLFDRSRRSVSLTEAGRIFLEDARRILALSSQAAETARRVEKGEVGQLKIGFTKSTAFTPIFPRVINAYRKAFPKVSLILKEMSTQQQLDALGDRSLDAGFIRPEIELPHYLTLLPLQKHPLAAVLPEGHRLTRRAKVSMAELKSEDFIMFPRDEGTTLNPHIYRLCAEAGFEPTVVMEAREAATIIGLVAAGCGVSILPNVFSSIGISGTKFRLIDTAGATAHFALAGHVDSSNTAAQAFFGIAKDAMGI